MHALAMALQTGFPSHPPSINEILSPRDVFSCIISSSKSRGLYCFVKLLIFSIALILFIRKIVISAIWQLKSQLSPRGISHHKPEDSLAYKHRKQSKPNSITTSYRLLYHQLQNAEIHPEATFVAWGRLMQLFDVTLSKALQASEPTILSVPKYNVKALTEFLANNEAANSAEWTAYLSRRAAGGPRELLATHSYAEQFLRLSAPVKFVDGAWLSRVHQADTAAHLRHITRIVWQILSEELGDGDLAKNHVNVYADLLQSINIDIGTGDSPRFIDPAVNPGNDPRVWAAAIAQLALGMFPDELLPEIIGFNLAYEAVAPDTLICVHELKELRLDATYFNLHVTIDNADSGHTAMALHAVAELMDTCTSTAEEDVMWRRVQAGYILAQGLPVHPRPTTTAESAVLDMFSKKCGPAQSAHQCCKAQLGGRNGMKLGDWMDPEEWEQRKYKFLEALASSNWVTPGRSMQSRLVKEVMWGGRMFGAFTASEVTVLKSWIEEMEGGDMYEQEITAAGGVYARFTKRAMTPKPRQGGMHYTAVNCDSGYVNVIKGSIPTEITVSMSIGVVKPAEVLLVAAVPLQQYLASPAKCATSRGMLVLRVLRALNGLANIGNMVAGMDEVVQPSGVGIADLALHLHTGDSSMALGAEWGWLIDTSLAPEKNFWFLVGAQSAFVLLLHYLQKCNVLGRAAGERIQEIKVRVKQELETLEFHHREDSRYGFSMVMNTVALRNNLQQPQLDCA